MGLVCLGLSGCTVGPNYHRPAAEVPDAWRTAVTQEMNQTPSTLESWWTELDDPVLDGLIADASAQSLDLQIAFTRILQTRAIRGIARADYYPTVDADAAVGLLQNSDNGMIPPPEDGFGVEDLWTLGISAFWEPDLFGRVRRSVEATSAQLAASVEDYRDVMVVLYADIAGNYVEARTLQERLRLAKANAAAQRETLTLTRDRFSAGLTSARDVAQAESNLATTEAEIPSLEINIEFTFNRLAVLLGEAPGAVHDRLAAHDSLPEPKPDVVVGLPADLLRRRPDIRAAERRLAAQNAAIGVATADLYPSFSLSGVLALESTGLSDLFEGSSRSWSLIPGLRWNIFDRGRLHNRIDLEEARTREALLFYEKTILLALEEVENGLVAFEGERLRLDRLRAAVAASQRTVDLVRTQYTAGLTDFQSLLDAQRSLFRQQDASAQSEGQVVQNLITLNRALGGGWPASQAGASEEQTGPMPEPPQALAEAEAATE